MFIKQQVVTIVNADDNQNKNIKYLIHECLEPVA